MFVARERKISPFLNDSGRCSRRTFLGAIAGSGLAARRAGSNLAMELGITTSSVDAHLASAAGSGSIAVMDLPRIVRDELDMRVIDLNTNTIAKLPGKRLDAFRQAAYKAGCVLTNLKMNQRGLDMDSSDPATRMKALTEYKRSIDSAANLGCLWARPLPNAARPDLGIHTGSCRELAEYAAERKVELLVENYGWMSEDPDAIPVVIRMTGANVKAGPDTGNWSDAARYVGLEKAFPLAVTCDFKAYDLAPDGSHQAYDLERCFRIGWRSGFRGPWCFEHANPDRAALFRELAILRDMLRRWMKGAPG